MDIFLDLDGVLADLRTAMHTAWLNQSWLDVPTWLGYHDSRSPLAHHFEGWFMDKARWTVGPVATQSFWETIPLYPWADELVVQLRRRGHVRILSSPGRPEFAAAACAGKMRWCQRFLGMKPRDVLLVGSDQKQLIAGPGRVLIDDTTEIITAWNRAGGIGILFPQPWNRQEAA
jgi:beta-phosphoglucomutase-like phosphatase (HAD superfamily)